MILPGCRRKGGKTVKKNSIMIILLVLALLLTACKKDKTDTTMCEQVPLPHTLDITTATRWTNTNVYLAAGQSVQINASGKVFMEDGYDTTPDGKESCENAVWGNCTIEGIGWGALMGRIGDGSPFVVGSSARITAEQAGCLSLGTNDTYYKDNSGSYSVTIEE